MRRFALVLVPAALIGVARVVWHGSAGEEAAEPEPATEVAVHVRASVGPGQSRPPRGYEWAPATHACVLSDEDWIALVIVE
jgi:hypothetical protein